jgi:hypothetical protein
MEKAVTIYLAGGMRTNWQDTLIEFMRRQRPEVPVIYLDPRQSGAKDEETYTAWDVAAVAMADILFVYLEAENPSGAGLALEIGVAEGLKRAGKPAKEIVFVCDPKHPHHRYFGMARVCSNSVYDDFQQGLQRLADFLAPKPTVIEF